MRVAENGNMSEVARQLNITNAAVSAAIKRLEASLNVSLFERTTRSVRLSPAGQAFLPHVQQALGALDSAEAELRNMQTLVAGEIRLGLPSDFGRNLMLPWLDAFQLQHPPLTSLADLLQHYKKRRYQPYRLTVLLNFLTQAMA
jgi:DNA-binding transcriptional LysR family regulator